MTDIGRMQKLARLAELAMVRWYRGSSEFAAASAIPNSPPASRRSRWPVVELSGIEPLTSSLRTTRSPN